jgi:hypothetical protein
VSEDSPNKMEYSRRSRARACLRASKRGNFVGNQRFLKRYVGRKTKGDNQSKELEKKIEIVLREIKEDMAGIVEESKARRKELAAAREKEGERGHAEIVRSKERKQQEREREKRVERRKKARTHSEIVPEREDHQIEAKKKIKARKWIRK